MKKALISVVVLLLLTAGSAHQVSAKTKSVSAEALVADLYRQHNRKRSPFFQTRNRALVNKYFIKALADLIWKDAVESKGEVGALGADPLYDAQDTEIKKFVVGKSFGGDSVVQVPVSFENFGQQIQIIFLLTKTAAGWKISDIRYPGGHTLRSMLAVQP